ncbi:MAG: hypothetical protein FGM32_07470 [Candidatus Kapabacteria bacterium]|nr:hypothetical protein [Candidatus Kapabacteria bacterium]
MAVKTVNRDVLISLIAVMCFIGCDSASDLSTSRRGMRPPGAFGRAVNTRGDDFAAGYESTQQDSFLMFTSNVNGRESVYRVPLPRVSTDDSVRVMGAPYHEMPSALARNTGTVASNDHTTVFAISAAVQKDLARILKTSGAVVGGSDVFERRKGGETRNIEEVNSSSWDAQPTLSVLKGMEIMVFSSDRMSREGFSAPYEGAEYKLKDGSVIHGNADLWYSFRPVGADRWSAPRNFRGLQSTDSVNTPSNEYSPFLYCIGGTPHLLFASNRGGNYDIYDAAIEIDAPRQAMSITSVRPLPTGRDAVNTEAREMFPFVPFPHNTSASQLLVFSSDRFATRDSMAALREGAGGLDLYRLTTQMLCEIPDTTPPPVVIPKGSITYIVTVIDGSTGKPGVLKSFMNVMISGDQRKMSCQTDSSVFSRFIPAVDSIFDGDVVTFLTKGGSFYTRRPCTEREPVVTSYARRVISDRIRKVSPRQRIVTYDTTVQDAAVAVRRVVRLYDTLARGKQYVPSSKRQEVLEATTDGRLRIGRDTTLTVDSLPPVRTVARQRTEFYSDTTFHYDTSYIPASDIQVPSVRTSTGALTVRRPQRDTVIHDTVIVYPVLETAAPCMQIFATSDSVRNVPYFQTGFWEVNNTTGYERHLNRLRQGDLEDASWIELNWRNKYWGSRASGEVTERLQRRRAEYRKKAQIIDDNIDNLAERTSNLLQRFWRDHATDPNAKVIISMMAYSDVRPIMAGRFISDTSVRYIAASYDSVRQAFVDPINTTIAPGSSLVGADNDTLSKLRAYYGYTAVMEKLAKDSLLTSLRGRGLVVLPTDATTPDEYTTLLRDARVIILAEGRKVDLSVKPKTRAYVGDEDDYYDLDAVRRVDVHVRRVDLRSAAWVVPECCR